MDGNKPIAGILAGTAFITGMEAGFSEFQIQADQQRFVQWSNSRIEMILIGRPDHGADEWPYAPHTYQGIISMVATPSGSR